ncbi:hypothetical protein Tco_1282768 [Tanacetum coccineum]
MTRVAVATTATQPRYRGQRGGRGNDNTHPLTKTPKGDTRNQKVSNFPKTTTNAAQCPEEQRVGEGYTASIIGRKGISAIRAVPSTAHGMLKFPVDGGIVTIYNTAAPPKECNTVTCDVTQTQGQHATKVTNLKGQRFIPDNPLSKKYRSDGVAVLYCQVRKNAGKLAERAKAISGGRAMELADLRVPITDLKQKHGPQDCKSAATISEIDWKVESLICG